MLKPVSTINYYLSSLPTLIKGINLSYIPYVLFKKPILIKLKKEKLEFYVQGIMDIWIVKEVVLDRCYERVRKIQQNDFVIDIGASIGDFSILASKEAKFVYSYEINKARISLMEKNIRINNCKNIKLFEKRARTLDSIFEENKIRKCNFLKIDCEGCEYEIFKNTSPKYLSRIDFIALEAHTFNKKMVTEYKNLILMLKQNKFKTREEVNPVHSHIKLLFASK